MTFGGVISTRRKALGLTQKELAARIKKEDGTPISAQYLNDLEHDRRHPPSQEILRQFADELKLPAEYLLFLAGELPSDLPHKSYGPERVERAYQLFRRALEEEP